MNEISAKYMNTDDINDAIRKCDKSVKICDCLGQRFISAGMSDKDITVVGTPGNALGAYLNGATIKVVGNAQDAVGDTMNDGKIIVDGNIGDAAGYAMRGGSIFVKGNAGYRAGIHMKEYQQKKTTLVIGGTAGSFLGEYQAGGTIIVLNLGGCNTIVGNYVATGMHGGKMLLRADCKNVQFPKNVHARTASTEDLAEFMDYLTEFCNLFGYDIEMVLDAPFTIVQPDSANPYKQMYVMN